MEEKQTRLDACHITKNLTNLLADAINLATFAVENGRLPDAVSFSELFRMWEQKVEKGQRLSEDDVDNLQYYYQLLEVELSPVTANSLRATDPAHMRIRRSSAHSSNPEKSDADLSEIKSKGYLSTEAGKHAKRMWGMAFFILVTIVGINFYQYMFHMNAGDWAQASPESFGDLTLLYWLTGTITPFAYGAFGATVRMLRITEQRLRERSFDPRRTAEHTNRLVLGTLSGGVIVLVFSVGGVGETDVKLTEAALGFLAGYSIDLLFSLLDRMVNAISPAEDAPRASVITKSNSTKKIEKKSFAKTEIEKAAAIVNVTETVNVTPAPHAETNKLEKTSSVS